MLNNTPKQALFEQFAAVAKALGQAHRLGLLEFVAQGERSVDSLAARTGLPVVSSKGYPVYLSFRVHKTYLATVIQPPIKVSGECPDGDGPPRALDFPAIPETIE
ncbi:MAG: hypothetical protein O7E57_10325 [Gammaproteobacteria bacterium]|nr:hypothetical protein [Gammaproteobacteria bacterium]